MPENELGLSETALQIATDKPPAWEHRLFAQILIDEVESIKILHRDNSRQIMGAIRVSLDDYPPWAKKRFEELQSIVEEGTTFLIENHDHAFGPPGQSGDVAAIALHARRSAAYYLRALEWSTMVRNTTVDPLFTEMNCELAACALGVTDSIERCGPDWLEKINDALSAPPSTTRRNLQLSMVLRIHNDRLDRAIERLNKSYDHKVKELRRSNRLLEVSRMDPLRNWFYGSCLVVLSLCLFGFSIMNFVSGWRGDGIGWLCAGMVFLIWRLMLLYDPI